MARIYTVLDEEMSSVSSRPVQNKVIKAYSDSLSYCVLFGYRGEIVDNNTYVLDASGLDSGPTFKYTDDLSSKILSRYYDDSRNYLIVMYGQITIRVDKSLNTAYNLFAKAEGMLDYKYGTSDELARTWFGDLGYTKLIFLEETTLQVISIPFIWIGDCKRPYGFEISLSDMIGNIGSVDAPNIKKSTLRYSINIYKLGEERNDHL